MTQTVGKSGDGLAPRFENGEAMRIAGLRGRFGNANRDEIPALWRRFGPQYFGRLAGQVGGKAYGVCANMDGAGNVDYLAGVEVIGFEGLPTELTQISLAPHRYAVFAHAGHISLIGRTWMEIFDAWLARSGYQMAAAPSFECYSEAFDPEVGMDNVDIWIPIKA